MTRWLSFAAALIVACTSNAGAPRSGPTTPAFSRKVDVGGYGLEIWCWGSGSPTVVLDAGYDASGYRAFSDFKNLVENRTRVCTYDRAGIGQSDPRPPDARPDPDMGVQADELHILLERAGVDGPYVIMAHSYAGLIARIFAQRYPDDTAGLVLEEASNEWEEPIYRRLHAGPWIDGGVKMDIEKSIAELKKADHPGDLGSLPLVVVSAQIIQDKWLATVPKLERSFQARVATLSTNSVHVEAEHTGHFIHDEQPALMATAVKVVLEAARSGDHLEACSAAFADAAAARCLAG